MIRRFSNHGKRAKTRQMFILIIPGVANEVKRSGLDFDFSPGKEKLIKVKAIGKF